MGKWKSCYSDGRKYNKEWEKEFPWLTWRNESCYCKVCHCSIKTLKKSNCTLHEKTSKHKKCAESTNIAKPINKIFLKGQPNVNLKIFEIKYSVSVACHCSIRAVNHHQSEIIKHHGKGSDFENLKLHSTKCAALIKNVVNVALFEELVDELQKVKYSLLIDESTDVSVTKLLCLCVRFFSNKSQVIKTEFLTLIPVVSTTGESLFQNISDFMDSIHVELSNCIGFSSDGASNVCGINNSVLSRLKLKSPNIIFVKCTCHSLALCAEHAFKKLPSNLEFLISEIARWFKCSSLRQEEFKEIFKVMSSSDITKPSKFITPSSTRWLVKGKCIYKILTQWHELKAYFGVINDKDKNYHARIINEMLNDESNYLYLTFVLPIVQDFENVNSAFQATNADPSKVFWDLNQLHKSLTSRIHETCFTKNALPLNKVNFGAKFEQELQNSTTLTIAQKEVIKQRCLSYLIEANCQIDKRLSENINNILGLRFFDPSKCLSQVRPPFSEIPTTIWLVNGVELETLEMQYNKVLFVDWKDEFPNNEIPLDSVTFWSTVKNYKNSLDENVFKELAETILNAHCIPLSNAVVERVFSHVTNVKTKLRNKLSTSLLTAILRIKTSLLFGQNCCKDFEVTQKMLNLFNKNIYKSDDSEADNLNKPSTSTFVPKDQELSCDLVDDEEIHLEEILSAEWPEF